MSEPARQHPASESPRLSTSPGPLKDWLAAMRATAAEARAPEAPVGETESVPAGSTAPEPKVPGWAPRLVAQPSRQPEQDEDLSEIMAENMMLRAKLRLEAERRDELQILLAQEIRELRSHILEEVSKFEDLRGERDLWKARCEALMQPLFQNGAR